MSNNIILASKSKVRKDILEKNNINCTVEPSNVDEDVLKESLLNEKASPEIISKNLAELKANKVSSKNHEQIVKNHHSKGAGGGSVGGSVGGSEKARQNAGNTHFLMFF